jgi:outer membrane protein assembly factor BamB
MEHAGQVGELVLRFAPGEDGSLQASLSLPTIDAWNAATLPVTIDRDGAVDLGPFTLVRQGDGLVGELPAALVPVHRIPFVLERAEVVEPPAQMPAATPTLGPLWVRDLGSPIWAGVAVAGGVLYVGTDGGRLFAIDAESGDVLWRADTGGAIRARPVLSGGTLFVPSDDGQLYALAESDGRRLFTTRLQAAAVSRIAPGSAGSRYAHYASSAACADGAVFIASHEGNVFALDARTGAERWRFGTGDLVTSTPVVDGGRVVVSSFDGHVYALDAENGSELWRFDTEAPVPSSPAVAGDLIVVGSRSYELFALDAATGQPRWRHYVWYSWIESSAVVRGDTVAFGSSDAQLLFALDLESGGERWRFDTAGSVWSEPVWTEDTVVVGTVGVADYMVAHRGGLHGVDRDTGRARWSVPLERPEGERIWGFTAAPAIDAGRLFAAAVDGRLYAFSLLR